MPSKMSADKKFEFDLHNHSYFSDGINSPEEIFNNNDADVIALTDHDTVAGVAEFLDCAHKAARRAIAGVEVSAFFEEELHILGYNINFKDSSLCSSLDYINSRRNMRNKIMLEKLAAHGMPLSMEEVTAGARATVNRLHIGKAMIRRGYVADFKEALFKYIGTGKCCFSPNYNMDVADTINVIKCAGGIPVLAHPVRYAPKGTQLEQFLTKLVSFGIEGVEVYYPQHSDILIKTLEDFCKAHSLIATAGSDRHGYEGEKPFKHELNQKSREVLGI